MKKATFFIIYSVSNATRTIFTYLHYTKMVVVPTIMVLVTVIIELLSVSVEKKVCSIVVVPSGE